MGERVRGATRPPQLEGETSTREAEASERGCREHTETVYLRRVGRFQGVAALCFGAWGRWGPRGGGGGGGRPEKIV